MRSAVVLFAVALALAWPQQGPGWEENSHYLGSRAIASGRAEVDQDRHRIGDLSTADLAFHDGHYYMDKAPGLALLTAPMFATLRGAGVETDGDPTNMLWALGLVGTVAPAALLLLLVRRRSEHVAAGWGIPVAVTLGLGTLLLPFATMFFSHALSAFLGFAAFALAWRAREGARAAALGAGVVSALAVTTEYPNGLLAIVLAVYLATGAAPRLKRVAAYAAGLVVATIPLLVYNQWAFGSPFHISYESSVSGAEGMSRGFYGISFPSARAALEMLFSQHGLLVLAPVLGAAAVGLVPLWRKHRAEAAVIAAIVVLYGIYTAGYFNPFGGLWPGPRYLVFVLPFLALPLAEAFRRYPVATASLALIGIANMVALTATNPHAAYHSRWFARIVDREFPTTAAAIVDITGWYAIAPFFFAAFVAVVAAARVAPRPALERTDLGLAAGAIAAWAVLFLTAPRRAELGGPGLDYGSYWIVGAIAAVTIAALVARRARTSAPWPLSPRATRSAR
jgi:hypothetical protein